MKFTIDLDTNNYFVQIFGTTEAGRQYEQPFAFQARGGRSLLERIQRCLISVVETIEYIDEAYHDCSETKSRFAKSLFHHGTTIFESGEAPVVAMIQERQVVVLVKMQQLGTGPLDVPNLLAAINTYLEQ